MGLQKLDRLEAYAFKAQEDMCRDGKAVIRTVLDEASQHKSHGERCLVKRDLIMKKVKEHNTTMDNSLENSKIASTCMCKNILLNSSARMSIRTLTKGSLTKCVRILAKW